MAITGFLLLLLRMHICIIVIIINLIRKRRPFRGVFIHPWLAIY